MIPGKVDSAVSALQAAYDNLEKTQDADKEDPDVQDPDDPKVPDTSVDPNGSSDTDGKAPSADSKDAPKTGDMTTSLPALILLVCVSGAGTAACLSRRKNKLIYDQHIWLNSHKELHKNMPRGK